MHVHTSYILSKVESQSNHIVPPSYMIQLVISTLTLLLLFYLFFNHLSGNIVQHSNLSLSFLFAAIPLSFRMSTPIFIPVINKKVVKKNECVENRQNPFVSTGN